MADQNHLQAAQQHAQRGRFPQMLAECQSVLETEDIQPASLLEVGVLLFNFGFLSQAQVCFEKAWTLSPNDLIPTINLANVARDMGNHAECTAAKIQTLRYEPQNSLFSRAQ